MELSLQHRQRVVDFLSRHRLGMLVLVFTDLVGSTKLKQTLGEAQSVALIREHHTLVRDILRRYSEGEEIDTAGDSFFLVFARPSDAVRFALELQHRNRESGHDKPNSIPVRIGVHAGEVFIAETETGSKGRDLFGIQVDTAARVMSLAEGNQVLITRFVFDNARQVLKGRELDGLGALGWLNHGLYALKGLDDPIEIGEVGEEGVAILKAPGDSEKAKRVAGEGELVLGWRPAIDQKVPGSEWMLVEKLGEGRFGEVWRARHGRLKQERVFKFCFRADRVRSLKREVTIFRILQDRVGTHPHLVTVHDVFLDEAPYYLAIEFVPGRDLRQWLKQIEKPIFQEDKIAFITQVAEGLQVAHEAGVLHRDIKPSNILVTEESGKTVFKLTDFGVGQVLNREFLGQVTQLGFTQTLSGSQSGTPLYMAPELVAGKPASVRSEIYALGVVLYQWIMGDWEKPLTTDWVRNVDDELLREDLERCFAGNPEDRFGSMAEFVRQQRERPKRLAELEQRRRDNQKRERDAYRRGILRTGVLAGTIILIVTLLALVASRQAGQLKQQATQLIKQTTELQGKSQRLEKQSTELKRQLANSAFDMGTERLERGIRNEGVAYLARAATLNHAGAIKRLESLICLSPPNMPVLMISHQGSVESDTFSPDRRWVVTASDDNTARVWEVSSGKPVSEPMRHQSFVNSATFSPDGRWVVTASGDKTARVWEASSGKPVSEPMQHQSDVFNATFSPDGRWVVTASGDKTARVWEASSGKPVSEPMRHQDAVRDAAFSLDGRWVVTASEDKTARVWEASSGKPVSEPMQHQSFVHSAAFSPDGRWVVTASEDKTARVWPVYTGLENDLVINIALALFGKSIDPENGMQNFIDSPQQMRELKSKYPELWYVQDSLTRTISPTSKISIPDWIEARLPITSDQDRIAIEDYFPIHPLAVAGIAHYLAITEAKTNDYLHSGIFAKTALAAEPGIENVDLKARLRYWLSRTALASSNIVKAREHIQKSLAWKNSTSRYWIQLATVEQESGDKVAYDNAMQKADEIVQKTKKEHPENWRQLMLWHQAHGREDAAKECANSMMEGWDATQILSEVNANLNEKRTNLAK